MPQVHGDNPTIITSEIAWLALTAMIMLTVFARRKSYELFYYCHVVIGLGFLAAALIHVRHCLSLVPSTAFPVCLPLPFPCVFHGLSRVSTAAFSVCLPRPFPCVYRCLFRVSLAAFPVCIPLPWLLRPCLCLVVSQAWAFWYYGVAGLGLWCVDAVLRTVHTARSGRGRPTSAEYDRVSASRPMRLLKHPC